jgi:hypothetical protein
VHDELLNELVITGENRDKQDVIQGRNFSYTLVCYHMKMRKKYLKKKSFKPEDL